MVIPQLCDRYYLGKFLSPHLRSVVVRPAMLKGGLPSATTKLSTTGNKVSCQFEYNHNCLSKNELVAPVSINREKYIVYMLLINYSLTGNPLWPVSANGLQASPRPNKTTTKQTKNHKTNKEHT